MNHESVKAASEAPVRARTFGRHVCLHCGAHFVAMHNRQTTFCALEHKRAANDLDKIRGRVLTKLVQTWRKGKKTRDVRIKDAARFAFQEICALGDLYNQEDAKDGRPSAVAHTQIMIAAGRKPSVDR